MVINWVITVLVSFSILIDFNVLFRFYVKFLSAYSSSVGFFRHLFLLILFFRL